MACCQRLWKFGEYIVGRVADFASQFQSIAETACGDQPGARALALDDGVDDQGGAVNQFIQFSDDIRCCLLQFQHSLLDGIGWVAGRGQALVNANIPGFIIQ